MLTSENYKALAKSLRELRTCFLPAEFDPSGSYNDSDFTRALAYKVMVHAEIESYIEERVLNLALEATLSYKNDKKVSKTLICLFAFSGKNIDAPPETINPPSNKSRKVWDDKIKINNKIDFVYKSFYNVVRENHGVREYNLLRLLLPIGIEVDELDQLWIAEMDTFGRGRGEIAHRSRKYTSRITDPKIELKNVSKLIKGMAKLDNLINELLEQASIS